MADIAPDGPGAAAAVLLRGEPTYEAATGLASIEHGVPNRVDTVFYLASTSKQFVGGCICILEAHGVLGLDDPVVRLLPELQDLEGDIRVHHLLHHTSGIRDKYALAQIGDLGEGDCATDPATLRRLALQRELNFAPGSRFSYSNSNYFLLAQVVERVSGRSIRQFADEHIFAPLGMTRTLFRDDATLVIPNRASGYMKGPAGAWTLQEYTFSSVGPGGVYSTVSDMARWVDGLDRGLLDPPDLDARLQRTRPLTDGKPNDYGCGVVVGQLFGQPCVHHAGAVLGHSAELMRFPETGLAITFLANAGTLAAPTRARRIAATLLGSPEFSPGEGTAGSPPVPGTYLALDGGPLVRVEMADDQYMLVYGPQRIPIAMTDSGPRVLAGIPLTFSDGLITLRDNEHFRRLPPAIPPTNPDDLLGTYRSSELEVDVVIGLVDGGLVISRGRLREAPVEWVGGDVFSFTDPAAGAILGRFTGDGRNLLLSTARAIDVRFARV